MSETLYGLADLGGTQWRVAVWDEEMREVGAIVDTIDPTDYEGAINDTVGRMFGIADAHGGEIVAVTTAVAGEVQEGSLVRAGGLSPWIGRPLTSDLAASAGLPVERVGLLNDMEAVGMSQVAVNSANGHPHDGIVSTLSSGWGGAIYTAEGIVRPDEPGHKYLRSGSKCPCGDMNHAEAYISGKGVELNRGVPMAEHLSDGKAAEQFVADLATATADMIVRHSFSGMRPTEIRWMGGVAMNQPLLMHRAEAAVRQQLGSAVPIWETVSLRDKAGVHGSFIHARNLARDA